MLRLILALFGSLMLITATGCDDGGRDTCQINADCPEDQYCLDGFCISSSDAGIDADQSTDADDRPPEDGDVGDADDGDSDVESEPPRCGDGAIQEGEACDDGDTEDGDGCSADCSVIEADYACPVPGEDCLLIVVCGNARIEGSETCDDRNTEPGDGCSDSCQVEEGWTCPTAGVACRAAECGDGIVAGFEACDDGDTDPEDGCDAECHLEDGYACDTPGEACHETVCGDGVVEGSEECEDGNLDVGDGCTPFCRREPSCTDGICDAVCGDGVVWAPEACDDGNTADGDGCSSTCNEELGFDCVEIELPDPAQVELPVTFRDFIGACGTGARLADDEAGAVPPYGHRDFECYLNGHETGMVANELGPDGLPQWQASSGTYSADSFALWYVSNDDYNRTVASHLVLPSIGDGVYQFDNSAFFPFDGGGFLSVDCDGTPCEITHSGDHNFHFTSEVRYWFEFSGTELLQFTGDDDVWVFINGRLAVDIGGVHGAIDGSVDLSDSSEAARLELTPGGIYEVVVFQAERHTSASNYRLTLTNFNRAPSSCESICGDGVVSSVEVCDDGINDGSYGGCMPDCTLAPYCGDGEVQEEFGEICDDGLNLGGNASACAPGCQTVGAVCGDGVVQTHEGEQCDDGNTEDGDGCSADCLIEIT